MQSIEKNRPEKKFRVGQVTATIWSNKSKNDTIYRTVVLERAYKDKNQDQWQNTKTLRAVDIPKAVLALNEAYKYLTLKESET